MDDGHFPHDPEGGEWMRIHFHKCVTKPFFSFMTDQANYSSGKRNSAHETQKAKQSKAKQRKGGYLYFFELKHGERRNEDKNHYYFPAVRICATYLRSTRQKSCFDSFTPLFCICRLLVSPLFSFHTYYTRTFCS